MQVNLTTRHGQFTEGAAQTVDRRKERRDVAEQPVTITWMEDPRASLEGHLVDVSDNGMKLFLLDPIAAGAAISVECEDCVVRAKVTYCFHDPGLKGRDKWQVGIQVVHQPWEMVESLAPRGRTGTSSRSPRA